MLLYLRWIVGLLVLTAAHGCADLGTEDDGGPPLLDGGTEPAAQLLVIGDPAITLLFGDEVEFRIRYEEADGTPIVGEPVTLALVGGSNDSTLTTLDEVSDASGEVHGGIVAGNTPSAFRIRASAERAAPAHIDVAVGDAGFGGLNVAVEWEGQRAVAVRKVAVFAERTCDDELVFEGAGDRSATLDIDETEAHFIALPAGLSYAVAGRGIGAAGTIIAYGCLDGVTIDAEENADTSVTLTALPLVLDGEYTAEVEIGAVPAATRLGTTARDEGQRLIDGSGSDAAFILDALETWLRGGGLDAEATAVGRARRRGPIDDDLNLRLSGSTVGPSIALDDVATELHERSVRIAIGGALSIDATRPRNGFRWTMTAVSSRSLTGAPQLFVDLDLLGTETTGQVMARTRLDDDTLELMELRLQLPLGELGIAILAAMAEERSTAGTVGLLSERAGCTEFVAWARDVTEISDYCDDACAAAACADGVHTLAATVEGGLLPLTDVRSVLSLGGELHLGDDDGDLRASTLTGERLMGTYASSDGSEADPVEGSLSGAMLE